jgi:hypothetical protein
MPQAVSRRLYKIVTLVQSQTNPCGICGRKGDGGTGFSPGTIVFPCQNLYTTVPYSPIYLSRTLYTASLNSAIKKNTCYYLRVSSQPFEVIKEAPSCVSHHVNSVYMNRFQHLLQMLLKLHVNYTCTSLYCVYI